jgi:transcription-repair coupling factor (superfamily II helicase)
VAYSRLKGHLDEGRQAYVVCPLVEGSETRLARAAEDEAERLRANELRGYRVGCVHGRLRTGERRAVMAGFKAGELDVLVATTVIEVGVDVPNATVMVVEDADRFGLSQLHQLRGRVGRSHHQAYAYLLTPPEDAVSKNAVKRLEAIQQMEELGSGFYLAMHDLEIRGAGEVLGESQSGEIQEIGFSLYARMLDRAVRKLKAGKAPEMDDNIDISTEVNLHVPALLPATYCSDVHERLSLYKRLADADSRETLDAMREELVDRFGELPEPARALLESHQVRIAARPLGVSRVDATHEAVQLQFIKNPPLDGAKVIEFIRRKGRAARLAGPEKLRVEAKLPAWQERAHAVQEILKQLGT